MQLRHTTLTLASILLLHPGWANAEEPPTPVQEAPPDPPVGEVEQENTDPSAGYPARYVDRPLTMPDRVIRLEGAIRLDHGNGDLDGSVVLGGAISFGKIVELGISPDRLGMLAGSQVEGALPLKFFDEVDLGSLPVYLRFRVHESDRVDIAADIGTSIPLETSPDVSVFGAALARIRLCDRLILDTGVDLRVTFINNGGSDTTLTVPVIVSAQLVDKLYGALRTGVIAPDFSSSRVAIPLGVEGGYALSSSDGPVVDLLARFEFPQLWAPGAGNNKVRQDVWALLGGVRLYLPFGQD